MVTLKKLTLHNLFGVKHVEVPLNNQGLVVIQGENGSGKSSIFMEGIFYCLYGQSFLYGKSPGSNVINRHGEGGKKGYGIINIEVDNQEYTIIRARNWKPYRNGLTLLQGDHDITSSKVPQEAVTAILGMPARTFAMSVMFPAEITRFPSMSDGDKKAILDDLLEMTSLDVAYETTRGLLTLCKEKVRQAISKLDAAKLKRETLKDEFDASKKAGNTWKLTHRQETESLLAEIRILKEELKDANENIEGARLAAEEDEEKWQTLEQDIDTHREEIHKEQTHLAQKLSFTESAASQTSKLLEEVRDRIQEHARLINQGKCPTCGADTDTPHLHEKAIDLKKTERKLETQLHRADAQVLVIKQEICASNAKRHDLEALQARCEEASRAKGVSDEVVLSLEIIIETTKTQIQTKIDHARRKTAEVNPHIATCDRIEKHLEKTDEDINKLSQQVENKEKEQQSEEALLQIFGPKGARLSIMGRAIPILNHEAKRIAGVMGTNIQISFTVRQDDESYAGQLQVDVNHPDGAASYKGLSRGEKRRTDLLILLSLLQLAISRGHRSFKQVFFDEAFESIDEAGEEAVMQVMRDISKHCNSVFTINHTADRISSMADKVWTARDGMLIFN